MTGKILTVAAEFKELRSKWQTLSLYERFEQTVVAALILVISAFQDNFSIAYIYHHSNRDLPAPYKFAVLWSGQEGSLLFWSLLLAAYGFVLRLRYKTDPRLFAYASVVLAGVQIFFLLLVFLAMRERLK